MLTRLKNPPLLLQAFHAPAEIISFDLDQWDTLLRQARSANLLASLHGLAEEAGILDRIPEQVRKHMEWARTVADKHAQVVKWEITHIRKALDEAGIPLILLKGAAYVMAGLPPARGRLFSDLDILVPKPALDRAEAALMMHGWTGMLHDAYDQRYYRQWMHELPPMQHVKRMTVIDVHHAILPETAPLHPDSAKLRDAACPIRGDENLKTLCPTDMALHCAVHMLHDGEMDNGLRDLVDFHRLLLYFGSDSNFWLELAHRAAILDLARPLYYALRYSALLLGTPVPPSAFSAAQRGQPPFILRTMMDWIFIRALLPAHPSCSGWTRKLALQALYLRANWLRMPPLLLARHLFHKAFLSPKKQDMA